MPDSALLIEPFYGGSHAQLIDTLHNWLKDKFSCHLITQPASKWHWRARTAALCASEQVPDTVRFRLLFCSSVLNLSELLSLRPHLHSAHKVVFFHENQLIYPKQRQQQRDFQFGYNEILTCLVADVCLFNSRFNLDSFLSGIAGHLKLMPPEGRPKNLADRIRPKCRVAYFPIEFPSISTRTERPTGHPLHILWPHRWEHDKNPDDFFDVLQELSESGAKFRLSVLGESYGEQPDVFSRAHEIILDHIVNWGRPDSRDAYFDILCQADVVVSTAHQETFGVAMLEAIHCGCLPLCPNRLVYPELMPKQCLYNTNTQLRNRLARYIERPEVATQERDEFSDLDTISAMNVVYGSRPEQDVAFLTTRTVHPEC